VVATRLPLMILPRWATFMVCNSDFVLAEWEAWLSLRDTDKPAELRDHGVTPAAATRPVINAPQTLVTVWRP